MSFASAQSESAAKHIRAVWANPTPGFVHLWLHQPITGELKRSFL
jgi:hypothetical protein